MQDKLIYIADDEANIRNIISSFLLKEGFKVEKFENGKDLLDAFTKKNSDMIILDIMMPQMDGYSLCNNIRKISPVPIIIVSAKDSETDKIAGLMLGGDDYLTKPFSNMELIARIKSLFRRIEIDLNLISSNQNNFKDLSFDLESNRVLKEDDDLNLTMMEFKVFHYLYLNQNRSVSRDELLDKIWGFEKSVETRATDDMIKRIRKKLTSVNSIVKIETIWGFGFKLED